MHFVVDIRTNKCVTFKGQSTISMHVYVYASNGIVTQ